MAIRQGGRYFRKEGAKKAEHVEKPGPMPPGGGPRYPDGKAMNVPEAEAEPAPAATTTKKREG